MIAYYFPPLGGGGVQRSAKFAKYLVRSGWRLEVVTVEPPHFELRDDSGLADVSDERIRIQRIKYKEKWRSLDRLPGGWRLRALYQDWLMFPDRMAGWLVPALDAAAGICKAYKDIAVFTTAGPNTAHLIGWHLKQSFNRPWIADFRDEWSQNPYLSFPARCLISRHRQAERRVLNGADIVLAVTDKICNGLQNLAHESGAQFHVIPNGFDPEDFKGLTPGQEQRFTITHVGTLNRERGKLMLPLIRQLNRLISTGQLPDDSVKLKLAGPGNYRRLNLPDKGWVETAPYLPHHDALQIMSDSGLLVLAESNPAAFTGKIFEYLALKRPILGLVPPQSPAAGLIRRSGAGWVAGCDDGPDMDMKLAQILLESYRAWKSGKKICRGKPEIIARYNREKQTRQLEELILGLFKKQER